MGYQIPGKTITLVLAADVARFKAVKVNSDGKLIVAGADSIIAGITQLPDVAGHSVPVMINGVSQVSYGAAVVAGASLSTDADGDFITAVAGPIVGIALQSGAAGVIGTALLK